MMNNLLDLVVNMGILEVLIPFLIGFSVIYGLLTRTQVIGDNEAVNMGVGAASGIVAVLSWSGRALIYNSLMVVMIIMFFAFVALIVMSWLNLDIEFVLNIVKEPYVLVPALIVIMLVYSVMSSGVLDPLIERVSNQTGMDLPSTEVESPEDLGNPVTVLAQPQITGTLLILIVFAVISYMITRQK